MRKLISTLAAISCAATLAAQQPTTMKPEDTELWSPVPPVVTPGVLPGLPPSDAIVLFDGKNLDEWVSVKDGSPAGWKVADGVFTVEKSTGDIMTKRKFTNYQLHIEYRIPVNVAGSGQARGNSGVFLARLPDSTVFELQVLDSYQNSTYVNGMAGSFYKQSIPLVNAARKPGEWNTYDVVWTAPTFRADGSLATPAYATVLWNGVLVDDHFELKGVTKYIGLPHYTPYTSAPIALQAHGDPSEPISFRRIWVRELYLAH